MSKKINLILGVHNHQPVGNFDNVLEEAYEKAYKPFIDVLAEFPDIKVSYHISGYLLKWFINKKPEFIDRLKNMVKAKQIEIIGGGIYEPILSLIPDRDKISQIKAYIDFLHNLFNVKPVGFWLAERVWEQNLAKFIGEAGCKYTIVDDYHFRSAGLREDKSYGYFITEDQNTPLNIFPISEKLRYYIPFKMPVETINFLKSVATEDGSRILTIVDDGEKFGIWPKTYDWVYKEPAPKQGGWLRNFFEELCLNKDVIRTRTFSEVMSDISPIDRFYLPSASYEEMMEWVLLPEAAIEYKNILNLLKDTNNYERLSRFVKGGFYRNFLLKYPESNNMQKKMFYVSEKVSKIKDVGQRTIALDELFQGQCNCAYWHGVFGGLYLKHLRNAVYSHLINAEKIADASNNNQRDWLNVEEIDFDMDGSPEILVSSDLLNVYFSKNYGGSIFEFDLRKKNINLIDTLSRKKETYHSNIKTNHVDNLEVETKSIHDLPLEFEEKDINKILKYDWYRKISLLDHFLGEKTTIENFRYATYHELGDFVNQPYKSKVTADKNKVSVELARDGGLWQNNHRFPVRIKKIINIHTASTTIDIFYEIENKFKHNLDLWFGVEFNVSLPSTEKRAESKKGNSVVLSDKYVGFEFKFELDKEANIWHFPIETVSQSIGRLEKVYQGSVVFLNWKFGLMPGQTWQVNIKKEVIC